jgi:hypothetical protein
LLFAAFWAIVSQRRGAVDVALRALVVSLAALTTPVALLLLPGAIVTMAVRRWRDDVIVVVSLLVSLALQGLAIHAAGPVTAFSGSTVRELPEEYGVRVLGSTVFGERLLDPLWLHLGMALIVIALAIVVAFVLAARPQHLPRRQRWLAAGALMTSGVTFVWTVWERGTEQLRLFGGEWNPSGSRYAVVPVLLLVIGVAALADRASRRWLRTALVVQGLLVIALSFGQDNPRADGPAWSSEVDRARQVCSATGATREATVRIAPAKLDLVMSVPCGRLR